MDFCAGSGNNFPLTLANFQFCYFVWGKLCMLMASVSYHDLFSTWRAVSQIWIKFVYWYAIFC